MNVFSDTVDEYLLAASSALVSGGAVLARLGWQDLLPYFDDDAESRRAVYQLFRAQGRHATTTTALGELMSLPYLALLPEETEPVTAALQMHSPRRDPYQLVAGKPLGPVLIATPDGGLKLIGPNDFTLRPLAVTDGLDLFEISPEGAPALQLPPGNDVDASRRLSNFAGRLALAADMLGAAESALATASEYAASRHQFGQPIGRFQAVRHMLAAARTDCAAVEALIDQAVVLGNSAPTCFDQVVKAVAGRNARRVCQNALQTLGAIGFTLEHQHYRWHHRVLALDTILGSAAHLAGEIAAGVRRDPSSTDLYVAPLLG